MLPLEDYRKDPCGTLSIPYHKAVHITVPPHMRIVHQRDMNSVNPVQWTDTPYFRLSHDLKGLPARSLPAGYQLRSAVDSDCEALAALINLCYPGSAFTAAEIRAWRQKEVFHPALWVICEDDRGSLAGSSIGEFDPIAREGALEWVQVHPEHRRRGLGAAMVTELLRRLQPIADFATVSGQVDNPTTPEALYRRCGFSGQDIWHILQENT